MHRWFGMIVAALCLIGTANASELTFNDGNSWYAIQDGYQDLKWEQDGGNFNFGTGFGFDTRFAYLNSGDPDDATPPAGFIGAPEDKTLKLTGGLFSANWAEDLDLTLTSYQDENEMVSVVIENLGYRSPRNETFDLSGDRITFAVSGSITAQADPLYDWQQYAFGMDNLNVSIADAATAETGSIPISGTLGLLGVGLVGLGLAARRRPRA